MRRAALILSGFCQAISFIASDGRRIGSKTLRQSLHYTSKKSNRVICVMFSELLNQ